MNPASMKLTLPESWYVFVPTKMTPSLVVWENPQSQKELQDIRLLLNSQDLGLVTALYPHPFVEYQEWESFKESVQFYPSERFFSPYSQDTGAGRNVIVGPGQYKGVGRNQLATRVDWLHCWGGMSVSEALSELIMERALEAKFPQASVPLLGLYLYEHYPHAFLIRSSDTIRCSQVVANLREEEKKSIFNYLKRHLPPELLASQWHQFICERFIKLYQAGFYHESPTLENITVDGRVLDHYSFQWCAPIEDKGHFFAEFKLHDDENTPNKENLKSVISSMEFLAMQCLSVGESFEHLGIENLNKEEIISLLKTHLPQHHGFLGNQLQVMRYVNEHLEEFLKDRDYELIKVDKATYHLYLGQRQRLRVASSTQHLVSFLAKGHDPKNIADLKKILESVSKKIFGDSFFPVADADADAGN
jgi:hypothetical protein